MEPPSATEARENDERIDMIKHVIASKSRVGKSHIFALKAAASVSVMSTSHNKKAWHRNQKSKHQQGLLTMWHF